jgi:small subunit ribosomal protein S16
MLTIRLARFGKKNRPFYRIVVTEKRSKRNGQYLKAIGYYNPLTNPPQINIKKDEFERWRKNGAQISEGLRKLLKYKKFKMD